MSDSEHTVVAGLLQKPTRIVDAKLDPDYFTDPEARALYRFVIAFHEKRDHKHALDLALARAKLEQSRSKHAGKLLKLVGEYSRYQPISEAEWVEALGDVVRTRKKEVLRSRGVKALEAMVEGDYERGRHEMRRALQEEEDVDIEDDRPIDIRSASSIVEAKKQIKADAPEVKSFDVGFPRLMRAVRFRPTELTILGGYSADGKTQLSKAFAYNASQRSGTNVLFVSLEMERAEIRAMFVAQHAATLDPRGVNWVDALDNRLNSSQRKLWIRALDDFEIKADDDGDEIRSPGGSVFVWAPRSRINQNDWMGRVRSAHEDHRIGIAVKDYTELVLPAPKRGLPNYRLDLKDMIEADKALARDLEILVIDNHQISRKGRDEAEKRKPPHYKKRDLGESSGLERAADQIIWIYSDEDLKDDREARVGVAKARKGDEIVHGYHVFADMKKSVIAELAERAPRDEPIDDPTEDEED